MTESYLYFFRAGNFEPLMLVGTFSLSLIAAAIFALAAASLNCDFDLFSGGVDYAGCRLQASSSESEPLQKPLPLSLAFATKAALVSPQLKDGLGSGDDWINTP